MFAIMETKLHDYSMEYNNEPLFGGHVKSDNSQNCNFHRSSYDSAGSL